MKSFSFEMWCEIKWDVCCIVICFCIKFALTDSAESVGMLSWKKRFSWKKDKILSTDELISILEISSPTLLLESNNTALTVQLITSRIISRCVARCRQLRSWDSNEFAHRVPFHSFAKSSGVACRRERGYIEAFEVLGFWDQIRSSVHALVRLL